MKKEICSICKKINGKFENRIWRTKIQIIFIDYIDKSKSKIFKEISICPECRNKYTINKIYEI